MHIETERLVLKPHTMDNVEKINQWSNDPELLYFNDDAPDDRPPRTLEDTRKLLEEKLIPPRPDGSIERYAIHRRDNGALIGSGDIAFIDRYNRRCSLGIEIGEKSEWGKGFGRETLSAVIHYCFTTLNMNRIGAEAWAFNERSIRMLEALGFKREGVVRQYLLKNGAFFDEYQYGLLREEWIAQHGQ
jgi:RimJ/RimL family protein N-acetyltransferase